MASLEDEFGDIIAKARNGLGYSTDDLASAAGLSPLDIENIEAYRYMPERDKVYELAQVLSLNPTKLADIAAGVWAPAVKLPKNNILIENIQVPYGSYRENCYILRSIETHAAAVVDPGGSVNSILRYLSENRLRLEIILITHAHADHTGGVKQLLDAVPDTRLIGRETAAGLSSDRWELAQDNVPTRFGNVNIIPLYTPGHTLDSTCYLVDGYCFVGDTLFAGSIGRPSAPQIYKEMLANIRHKLLSLPDNLILLPGHGPATGVAQEKAHNPFF